MVFEDIKMVRGFTIDDEPSNWAEIIEAFDNRQKAKEHSTQMVHQIIEKTGDWIAILKHGDVKNGYRYRVASNAIVLNCLQIIKEIVWSNCYNVSMDHLQPHQQAKLPERIKGIRRELNRLSGYYMKPEVLKEYRQILNKLSVAEEQLSLLVTIS